MHLKKVITDAAWAFYNLWIVMEELPYNPFVDVKEVDYFYKPVLWAVKRGITTGTSATTFSPHDPCTRGQIVTFLYRALT